MEMAKSVLGVEAKKKQSLVPLSNDILSFSIRDLSEDISQQFIADIKASPTEVSLQLDESIDARLCCQLLYLCDMMKKKKWWKNFYFVNR